MRITALALEVISKCNLDVSFELFDSVGEIDKYKSEEKVDDKICGGKLEAVEDMIKKEWL